MIVVLESVENKVSYRCCLIYDDALVCFLYRRVASRVPKQIMSLDTPSVPRSKASMVDSIRHGSAGE